MGVEREQQGDPRQQEGDGSPGEIDALLRRLVAECLEHYGEEGEKAVATVCGKHPELAGAIRKRMDALRRVGLLDVVAGEPEDSFPERLGDFRLIRRLGGGGMGVVYLADQEPLGRTVCLKLIRPEYLYFPGPRKRFQREVEAVARLQHPGIVPVYTVGEEKGIPYFAMEWVEGCTMTQVIRTLEGRAAKSLTGEDLAQAVAQCTPGAEAISPDRSGGHLFAGTWTDACFRLIRQAAEALDHAHRRGVIHRDIKPSNLMVTPAGRVMLLDFGLAHAEGLTRLTRTGTELGSLPYMSPEQVRGDPAKVDARTDIYSLGVTIYELLTLRLPYSADSTEMLRRRILKGRPEPLRGLCPSLSWDAETVCLTAMETDPARRYATAADLARDLTHVLDRRPIEAQRPGIGLRMRRWVQRHPAASVALFLGTLLLVGVPVSVAVQQYTARIRIDRALEQAKAERDSAEAQRQRAEATFQKLLEAVDRFLTRVGEVRLVDEPLMDPLRRELLEDALGFYEALLEERSEDPGVRHETARAHGRIAHILKMLGRFAEAEDAYGEAIAMHEALVAAHPLEAEFRLTLSDTYNNAAGLMISLNRFHETKAFLDKAERLRVELARDFPGVPEYREALANHRINSGLLFMRLNQPVEAEKAYREAVKDLEPLVAQSPGRSDLRESLATAFHNLGDLLRLQGRHPEAEPDFREAVKLKKGLVEDQPLKADFKAGWAQSSIGLGMVLMRTDRLSEAEEAFRTGMALLKGLEADFPDRPEFKRDMGAALISLGDLLRTKGRMEEAETLLHQAVEILKKLADAFPAPEHRANLATSYSALGILLKGAGRHEEAAEAWRKGLAIQDRLSQEFPGVAKYRILLAKGYTELAEVLKEAGLLLEAEDHFQEAVSTWEALAAEFPDEPRFTQGLAESHDAFGVYFLDGGRIQEAEKAFQRALGLREQLIAGHPGQPVYQSDLGYTLQHVAWLLQVKDPEDREAVRKMIEEAIRHQRTAMGGDPRNLGYRTLLCEHLAALCKILSDLGEYRKIAVMAEELAGLLPDSWQERVRAAVFMALCIAMAERDPTLPEADRAALRQDYAQKTISLLREAVRKGYRNLDELRNSREFDSLRSLEAFQDLLREVEAAAAEPANFIK